MAVKEVDEPDDDRLKWKPRGDPMVFWIASGIGSAIAYLFGSTSTGYLAGKLLQGIDLREHGSGSFP